jgi:HEAT repeat protein
LNISKHIFLSYRSLEAAFALRLAASLKNAGVRLWLDRMDIQTGMDWVTALQEGINQAAAIIAVISPDYVHAEYCKNELARAVQLGIPVFPVLLRPVAKTDWPIEIQRKQFTDFTCWQDADAYEQALRSLISELRQQLPAQFNAALDIETRVITNLLAYLETSSRISEYMEQITEADVLLSGHLPRPDSKQAVRPEAGTLRQQIERLPYALVTRPRGQPLTDSAQPPSRRFTPLADLSEALAQHRAVVLAGAAGAGKTLTLHQFLLEAAHRYQAAPLSAPLPLLIHLADWQDDESLPDFLQRHWDIRDTDLLRQIAHGSVLVCMDGLSELADASGAKTAALRAWLHSDSTPRAIITCRTEDYTPARDLGLPLVMIMELGQADIERFALHYLGDTAGDIFNVRVLGDGENVPYLYHLCRNPFLLRALILVFKSTRQGDVPDNLGQLLRQLTVEMWKRSPAAQRVKIDELETALTDLAYSMVDEGLSACVPEEYALEALGSRAVLQAAVAAHFLEIRGSSVRFAYYALQEYFAALGLARSGLTTRLAPPVLDRGGQRQPTRWDRPIVILCGILPSIPPNPDSNVWSVAQTDPFLALLCIACGINVQDDTLLHLLALLRDGVRTGEQDSRVAAAHMLAHIDQQAALSILIEALRDGTWDVRWAALQALWALDMPAMPGLAEALQELEDDLRSRAALTLRQLSTSMLPTLLRLLRDPNWNVRRGAAWALGAAHDAAALPALVDALYDDDPLVSVEAAAALGRLRCPAAIPWLQAAIDHEDACVRQAAAYALGCTGTPALADIVATLRSPIASDETRRLMVSALTFVSDPAAYEAVLEATHDPSAEVRCAAVEALEHTGDPRTVKRLIESLSDTAQSRLSSSRICDVAARLLQSLGSGAALVALERWRHEHHPRPPQVAPPMCPPAAPSAPMPPASKSAASAVGRLEKLTGRKASTPGAPQLDSPDWTARSEALRALKGADAASAVPALIRALADSENQVRIAAVETLAAFDTPEAVAALVAALNDRDYLVCDAVSEALKRVGEPAVDGLIALLESDNPNVRGAAVEILGALADARAVPALIARLFDSDYPWMSEDPISENAARALLAINTYEARDAVHAWRRTNPAAPANHVEGPQEPDLSEHGPGERPAQRRLIFRLLDDLHHPDWQTRQQAAKSLREYARMLRGTEDPELLRRLTTALADPDWVVRWAAAEALAWVRDRGAVPALVETLNDPNWTVRVAVVRALGELRDGGAAPDVMVLTEDKKNLVREAAVEALGLMADPRALPALERAVTDPEPFVRLAAVESLGRIGGAGAAQPLAQALRDSDNNVRWAAASVLRETADDSMVTELIACLDDTDCPAWEKQRVCDLALAALEHIASDDAMAAVNRWRQLSAVS